MRPVEFFNLALGTLGAGMGTGFAVVACLSYDWHQGHGTFWEFCALSGLGLGVGAIWLLLGIALAFRPPKS